MATPGKLAAAALLTLAAIGPLRAATTITTLPAPGILGTPTDVGETFLVPTNGDNVLASFSFTKAGAGTSTPFYEAYLFPFNNATGKVIGAALFGSGRLVLAPATFQNYPFLPLTPLTLSAGGTYLALISQQGLNNSASAEIDFRYNAATERKADPSFLRSDANNDGPTYANTVFAGDPTLPAGGDGQIGFTVNLVPRPSVAPLVLVGVGLLTWGLARPRPRCTDPLKG